MNQRSHSEKLTAISFQFFRASVRGAAGIELLFNFTKSRVFTVPPTVKQMVSAT